MNRKYESIIKHLNKRNIQGYYADTAEEAREIAVSLVAEGDLVSWGGSQTLDQTGIRKTLFEMEKEGKITIIDPYGTADPAESMEARRKGLFSDVFFMSSNALTVDGELVNIDGTGNRVAALTFGPKKVVVVVGKNKLTESLDEGVKRVKREACPKNAVRLGRKTPCALTGNCCDCLSPTETICATTVLTRFSLTPGRVHVVLVDEDLGF